MKKAYSQHQLCLDFAPPSRHQYEYIERNHDIEEALEKASGLHGPAPKSWAVKQTPTRFNTAASLPGWVTAPSGNPYAKASDEVGDVAPTPIRETGLRERRAKQRRIRAREIRAFCGPFYSNLKTEDRAKLRDWIKLAVAEINDSEELLAHARQRITSPLLPLRRPDEVLVETRPDIEKVIGFLRNALKV